MNHRRRRLVVSLAAIATLVLFALNAAADDNADENGHTKDTLKTVKKNVEGRKAVLIDVREAGEWKRGHLKAATLVPLSKLRQAAGDKQAMKQLVKGLPKKKIIYCHCASGGRVLRAAPILRKAGFTVRALSAGYGELVEAGFAKGK